MTSTKKDKNQQIQVFVRVRPLNKQEGHASAVEIKGNRELSIKHHSSVKTYTFDRVFGPDSQQLDVYKMVAAPTVQEVIAGYNCTVLAYGQTGTGKTYTMAGGTVTEMSNTHSKSAWFEDIHSGIIPRTLAHMFDELSAQQFEYTVRVSYLELYNEEIFDLLSPVEDSSKLKLYDDMVKKGSVIVHGLTETTVNTKSEVFRILEKGAEKRRIASTMMNAQSSRSHTVFCITVHTKENSIDGEDLLKTGKLYLVDLAGSENIKQSGATDMRAREAFNINQSLLTLGRCISKLLERSAHIPYRESKLTRLLQDSLGGRTKTTLIATVSPGHCNVDESINTLEYAHRAKSITNKPEINQRLSKKTLLKEYTEEIERLRKDLLANRMGKGIFLDEENYESLLRERNTQKDEITEKINMIQVMQEEMIGKEQLCEQLKISLAQHQKEVEIKVHTIYNLEDQLSQASKEIIGLQQQNELEQFIVEKYSETAEQLQFAAKELITVADTSTVHERKLHDKLDVIHDINKYNKQVCEKIFSEFNSKISGMNNYFQIFHDKEYRFHQDMCEFISSLEQNNATFKDNCIGLIGAMCSFSDDVNVLKNEVDCNCEKTRIEFELSQCNITQAVDTAKTNRLNKFNSSMTQNILKLFDLQLQQEEFVVKISQVMKSFVENHSLQVTEFVGSCKNIVVEASLAASKYIEKELEVFKTIDERITKQEVENTSYQQKMATQFKNITEALQNMQADTVQHGKANERETMQCRQELHGLQQRLTEHKDNYVSDTNKTCEFIDSFNNSVKSTEKQDQLTFEVLENEKIKINDALTESRANVNKVLQEHATLSDAFCNDVNTACGNEMYNLIQQLTAQYCKQSLMLKSLDEKVTEVNTGLESCATEFCDNLNSDMNKMRCDVQANEAYCDEVEAVLSTDLDNCRESIRKLGTSSKEYKSTGETPQRKFYRYPRSIVERKPREILIEEFHKVRSVSASRLSDQNTEEIENQSTNELRASSESNIPKVMTEVLSDSDKDQNSDEKENQSTNELRASSESNIPKIMTDSETIRQESNTNRQSLREQN